jgi:hypothetical protein
MELQDARGRAPARARRAGRAAGARGFDWIVAGVSIWWMVGLFVDGWAHSNLTRLETFFTPWHALLYSGFAATAAALGIGTLVNLRAAAPGSSLVTAVRESLPGHRWLRAVPAGYELSLLGVVVFGVSGVGDLTWHLVFGIERSVDALLSPTHLGLALGIGLALSGPLRAAWRRADVGRRASWGHLAPAVLSLTFTYSLLTFFTEYASPRVTPWAVLSGIRFGQSGLAIGIAGILLQTALLMSFALLVARRWRLPLGVFTFVLGVNGALMAAFAPRLGIALLPSAVIGGLAADLLYAALRPAPERLVPMRAFAFAMPVALYLVYFVNLAIVSPGLYGTGITWTIHFWTGSIVLAGVVGWLLSYVMFPPATPRSARTSGTE